MPIVNKLPNRLQERHFIAATLFACGSSNQEVADAIGMSIRYLTVLKNSPLFVAEVQRLRDKLQTQLTQEAKSALHSETNASVAKLVQLRDKATSANIQLQAANSILDRVPETSKANRNIASSEGSMEFTDEQVSFIASALNDDPVAREAFMRGSQPQVPKSMLDLVETEDTGTWQLGDDETAVLDEANASAAQ